MVKLIGELCCVSGGQLTHPWDAGTYLIVRCYETERRETEAVIRLPQWGRAIHKPCGLCAIRTFRVSLHPEQPVAEIDPLEREALRIASLPGCRARQPAEGAVV